MQNSANIGVIIRDSDSSLIGACSKKLRIPLGVVEVKAKAVEFGLQFSKDLLIQDFIMEGDSLVVFNALSETSPPPSSIVCDLWFCICFLSFVMLIFPMYASKTIVQPIFSLNML